MNPYPSQTQTNIPTATQSSNDYTGMIPIPPTPPVQHRHNGVPAPVQATIPTGQTTALERVILALELQLKDPGAAMLALKTQLTLQAEQLNTQGRLMKTLGGTMISTQMEVRSFANNQRKLQDYQHKLYLNSNRLQHSLAMLTRMLKSRDRFSMTYQPSHSLLNTGRRTTRLCNHPQTTRTKRTTTAHHRSI